jgi:hypothetical protein
MTWEKMDDVLKLSDHVQFRFERREVSGGHLVATIRQEKSHGSEWRWFDVDVKCMTFVPGRDSLESPLKLLTEEEPEEKPDEGAEHK